MSKISELLKSTLDSEFGSWNVTVKNMTESEKKQLVSEIKKVMAEAKETAKELLKPFSYSDDNQHYSPKNADVAKNKSAGNEYEWTTEDKLREEHKKEAVNHPSHYKGKKFEVIDIIDDYSLNFNLGNSLKYLLRAGHKDDYCQDLRKAVWYLNREIDAAENSKADAAIPKGL